MTPSAAYVRTFRLAIRSTAGVWGENAEAKGDGLEAGPEWRRIGVGGNIDHAIAHFVRALELAHRRPRPAGIAGPAGAALAELRRVEIHERATAALEEIRHAATRALMALELAEEIAELRAEIDDPSGEVELEGEEGV